MLCFEKLIKQMNHLAASWQGINDAKALLEIIENLAKGKLKEVEKDFSIFYQFNFK